MGKENEVVFHWDHKEALDRDIEEGLELVNQIQKASERAPLEDRLKSKGLV